MSDTLTKCRPHIVNIGGVGTNSDTGWINYTWQIQGGLQNGQYHAETYLTPGTDTIVLIDSNVHGCRDTAYATMTVLGFAGDFYVSTHLGCSPLMVTVGVAHSTDTATWVLNGHTYMGVDTVTTAFTTAGLYTAVLIRADTACQSVSVDTIRVDTVIPALNAAQTSICLGQPDTFINVSTCLYSTVAATHWDFGDGITGSSATAVHTYNTPGTYVVAMTATSVLGCTNTTTLTITVNAPPSIDLAGHTTPVCAGQTVTLYDTVSGGMPGYSYAWSGPGGYTSAAHNPVRTPFVSGMEGAYTLVATDANGCKDTATVIVPPSPPIPVLTGPSVVCQGSAITITATLPGGTWTVSNGNATVTGSDAVRAVVTGVTAGTVTISYSGTSACDTVATFIVTVNGTPSIDLIGHTMPVCAGSTVTLYDTVNNGTPGYAYSWHGPSGYTSAVHNPVRTPFALAMAGSYTLVVTDANGCKDTATMVIPPTPTPAALTGPYTTVCVGSMISFTGTPSGGTWAVSNTNATVTSTGVLTGAAAGTVTISYTVTDSCGSIPATRTITVYALPTISPSPTSVCVGSNRTLTGSPTGTAYVWSSLTTSIATVSATGRIGGVASGTAYVRYTNTVTGCYATDTITVNPLPAPINRVGGGRLLVCQGDSIQVHDSTAGGYWTKSSTSTAFYPVLPATDSGLRGVAIGTTTITYTLASTGCARTATVNVASNPTATITPAVQAYCSSPVSLTAKGSGGRRFNSIPNYTYIWASDPTIIPTTVDSIINVSGLTATHMYTVTVTDTNGCRATATAQVLPLCSDLCGGGTVSLLGTGGSIASGTYGPGTFYIDDLAGTASTINMGTNVIFDNAVVAIAPGKLLAVSSGESLTISGSHLYSCSQDTMWQGIKVSAGGYLTLKNNSLIEDAITAVWMANPSTTAPGTYLMCNSVIFNRNRVGVQATTYSGTGTTYPFSVFNTVFTSRNMAGYTDGTLTYPFAWPAPYQLKLPYAPPSGSVVQPPYNIDNPAGKPTSGGGSAYTRVLCKQVSTGDAYAGINLLNVGTTGAPVYPGFSVQGNFANIENPIIFDNMTYGVYDSNSQFTITGGIFMYCHPNSASHVGGAGIRAVNLTGGPMVQLSVNLPTASDTTNYNAFYDCKYGVDCQNIRYVYGKYNRMYSTHAGDTTGWWGYKVSFLSPASPTTPSILELNGNYFGNIDTGIHYLVYSGLYGDMHMCRNQFIAQPTSWSGGRTNMAIFGSTTSAGSGSAGILHTDSNEIYLATNGIYLNLFQSKKAYTNGNNIWLHSGVDNNPNYGIRHTACKSNVIQKNYVKSDVMGSAIGISGESNLTAIVSCDSVEYLKKGFNFSGIGNTTTWRNNSMNNCAVGFHIDNGYIGTGVDTVHAFDNKWWGAYSFHTFNAGVSNAFLSRMFVRVNSGGMVYDPYINSDVSGGTSNKTFGWPTACSAASCFNTTGGLIHAPDSITNNCVPTGVDFPIDLDYMPAVTDTLGKDDGGGEQRGMGDDSHVPERIKWIAQMHVWCAILAYPAMADSSTVLNKFREEALNSRYNWLTSIVAALDTNDILTAQTLMNDDIDAHVNTNTDAATGVVISDATEADYVVGNYLSYYDQYIKYLNGNMHGEDTATVFTLAGLCPFTDGEIIYSARTLAAMLGGNVAANDEGCAASAANKHNLVTYKEGTTEQRYKLYPNPNNGIITVSQLIADTRDVKVEVVDAMGKILYDSIQSFENQNARIQLSNVSPGLYLLKLINADGKVFSFKFVVQ